MKTIAKKLGLLCIGIFAFSITKAQRLQLALNYNVATPVNASFKEYVSKTSFRGAQGSVLYRINNDFRVGLQASYNDFYEKYPRQVYKTTDGSDISTVLTNTLQNTPVVVKGEYNLVKTGRIKPYVGLGAGINFINYDQYLGEFEYSKFYTKAAFTGDAGIVVPFSPDGPYGFRLSTSYNYLPFNAEGIKRLDTWSVQAGVVLPLK
jgi:hypothetical protein